MSDPDTGKGRDELLVELRAARRLFANFREMVDRSPDPGAVCDARHRIVYANPALLAWLGHRVESLLRQPIAMLVPDEDRGALAAYLESLEAGIRTEPMDQRFVDQQGRVAIGQVAGSRIRFDGNDATLLAIRNNDITPQSHARLRMLETAVDHLRDVVFITEAAARDAHGRRVVFVNRTFTDMTGYQPDEVIGPNPQVTLLPDTDREALSRLEVGLRERRSVREELKKFRKDGSSFWVEIDIIPVWDQSGRHTHWVSVQRDLTERREFQARLLESERLASVGMLASGVAHEINNPLAYVVANLGFVSEEVRTLSNEASTSPDVRERLDALVSPLADARDGADRVRRIVADLKSLARSKDLACSPTDVRAVLEASINMAIPHVRGRARLIREFEPVPQVSGSEARLGQVFFNLLLNAAESIAPSALAENIVRVVLRRSSAGDVVIEIHDTGCGIAQEFRARIFTPFYTTKRIGDGTGLGLSICHGIVTSLGGSLSFESVVGQGSVFRVTMPALAADAGTDAV